MANIKPNWNTKFVLSFANEDDFVNALQGSSEYKDAENRDDLLKADYNEIKGVKEAKDTERATKIAAKKAPNQ